VNFFTNAVPRRDVPIDRPDFVPWLIFAHILEVHAASFENAVVIARKHRLHEALRFDFEGADFFKNFRGGFLRIVHHGTGKPANILSTIVSLVIDSASAS
jgi:hypothetical protein